MPKRDASIRPEIEHERTEDAPEQGRDDEEDQENPSVDEEIGCVEKEVACGTEEPAVVPMRHAHELAEHESHPAEDATEALEHA
jgi:hypothetical protein